MYTISAFSAVKSIHVAYIQRMSDKKIFETSPKRLKTERGIAWFLWFLAAIFAAGGFYFYNVETDANIHLATRRLTLAITLVSALLVALLGTFWYLLIRKAAGRIEISPDGISFENGRYKAAYAWHAFEFVQDDLSAFFSKAPWPRSWEAHRGKESLLLVRPPGLPTHPYSRWRLKLIAEKQFVRPRERGPVVLLPLGLFSAEDAKAITQTAKDAHAKATGRTGNVTGSE